MENESQVAPKTASKMMPVMIVVAIIVIVAIAAITFSMNKGEDTAQDKTAIPTQPAGTMEAQPTKAEVMTNAIYKDGEYTSEGEYTSPGGEETIGVTVSLKDGVVEDAEVVANATRPISKKMQDSFVAGYKDQVIGKKIDELNLTKVSASSLAPKGFNDALEKIKAEAKV